MYKKRHIILLIFILIFIILEISHLLLPPIHYDEALIGWQAYNIKQWPTGGPYHGAFEVYLIWPFVAIFGCNLFSLRLYGIFVGILTILATYLVAKEFFNLKAALLVVALLVFNFTFLEIVKMGALYTIMPFIMLSALYSFLKWGRSKNNFYFYLGAFLLGTGQSIRIWFLWYITALLVTAIVLNKYIFRHIVNQRIRFRIFIIGTFYFCMGAFLLIIHNLSFNFVTVRTILNHLRYSKGGIDNFAVFANLSKRFGQFMQLLNGNAVTNFFDMSYVNSNQFYPWLFALSLFWLVVAALFLKKRLAFDRKKVLVFLLMLCISFLSSIFTISAFDVIHLFILIPLIQLIIAVAIISFLQASRGRGLGLILLLLILPITKDMYLFVRTKAHLEETGGEHFYSDAIYRLMAYLEKEGIKNPLVSHWHISYKLSYFSCGKIVPDEIGVVTPMRKGKDYVISLREDALNLIEDQRNVYIDFSSQILKKENNPPDWPTSHFIKAVEGMGRRMVKKIEFCQRNGVPTYVVYTVE